MRPRFKSFQEDVLELGLRSLGRTSVVKPGFVLPRAREFPLKAFSEEKHILAGLLPVRRAHIFSDPARESTIADPVGSFRQAFRAWAGSCNKDDPPHVCLCPRRRFRMSE